MKDKELLERANDHFFSLGLDDSSAQLGKANTVYGLAKIQSVQEQLGYPMDATFISSIDLCPSKNEDGWKAGFGYGGKLVWGTGQRNLVILDVHANACGVLFGGLDEIPKPRTLLRNIEKILKTDRPEIKGIEINWDLGRRNHFLRVNHLKSDMENLSLPPYGFLIHCSAGEELKRDNNQGTGLYLSHSEILKDQVEVIDTPFGPLNVLTGKNAQDYAKQFEFAADFAKERRRVLAERLFGDFVEITNRMHQGLLNMNQMLLGVQFVRTERGSEELYPIMLRGDLPISFLKGYPSFTEEQLVKLGFQERMKELNLEKYLLFANTLPHGGGYFFPRVERVVNVLQDQHEIYFCLEFRTGEQIYIQSAKWLEFRYRGEEVLEKIREVGLGTVVAKMQEGFTVKV